jgi:hypothetical protein
MFDSREQSESKKVYSEKADTLKEYAGENIMREKKFRNLTKMRKWVGL